jgi:hypothetical protein
MSRLIFTALDWKSVGQHVCVGMASASFWRGAWYILDDSVFPGQPVKSASASLTLGIVGMAASQGLVQRAESFAKTRQLARFGAIYTIAFSCVLVWRGTWIFWDVLYEQMNHCPIEQKGPKSTDPGHSFRSGILSHSLATAALLGTGLFASVLAPPAAASVMKDAAIKAGMASAYRGPAASVASRFLSGKAETTRAMSTKIARKRG